MDIYQDEKHVTIFFKGKIFRAYFGTIFAELSTLVFPLLCVNGNNRFNAKAEGLKRCAFSQIICATLKLMRRATLIIFLI